MARGAKKETALTPEEKLAQALVPEAEQPYRVPENWRWVFLLYLCEYMRAGGDKPQSMSDIKIDDYNIPVVANGLQDDGIIGYTNIKNEKAGTVTVSGRGTIGHSVLRNYPYYPVIRLIVLSPNQTVLAAYLKYSFDCFEEEGTGTSIPQLTVPSLKKKKIPLPPLPEQQRIVDRIESLFAKLDEAKEKAQAVVDGLGEIHESYLYQAFTGGLTANWRRANSNNSAIWEDRTLQSVCSMKITDGTHQTPTYCEKDEGIPFISAKDVTSGEICWDNIKYIIPELHDELYARLAPRLDDVLLAKNGTTGVAAIVDIDKVFDLYVTLAVLRPDKTVINPRYLLNVVNSPICKRQFNEHLTGIGVPNLHLRDIKAVTIPLPSLDEQAEIVRVLDKVTSKWKQAKEAAEQVIDQIDTMKKAILARAFRGELGTNDPTEKSAESAILVI